MSDTRRNFLKASALAGLSLPAVFGSASDVIRIGVIGCGGRGTAAALNAMHADPSVRLVALTDLLPERVQDSRKNLRQQRPEQVAVDDDHCFSGFDGYKHVIECVDVVLIANAAKFHPMHLAAAVRAGKHVFVEKPHAVDPAGIRVVRAAVEDAKRKGLSRALGLAQPASSRLPGNDPAHPRRRDRRGRGH